MSAPLDNDEVAKWKAVAAAKQAGDAAGAAVPSTTISIHGEASAPPPSYAQHAAEAPPSYADTVSGTGVKAEVSTFKTDAPHGAPTNNKWKCPECSTPNNMALYTCTVCQHKRKANDNVETVDASSPTGTTKPWEAKGASHGGDTEMQAISSPKKEPTKSSYTPPASSSRPPQVSRMRSTFQTVTGRDSAKCDIDKGALMAFWGFYLLHAFVLGCYFGFTYAIKSTLWLAGGFAFFFAIAFLCCCILGSEKLDVPGIFLLIVIFTSATFAGLLGGHYFQNYWYYTDLTTYDNVDTTNAAGYSGDAKYNFVTGTRIGFEYGGFVEYITTNNYYSTTHQVCVAPIMPPLGTPISNNPPFDVRFWVVGIDCCGTAATVSACSGANGWNDNTLFAVTIRNSITKSGDAISNAVSLYVKNGTNEALLTSTDAVYVDWTTEAAFEDEQKDNLNIGRVIISLHLALWPLWSLPVACFIICARIFK